MPAYAKFENWPGNLNNANGDPYASGTLTFVVAGTSTPAAVYSDDAGTALSNGVTVGVVNLNIRGVPKTSGGTNCEIYGNTSVVYDMTLKDSTGAVVSQYDSLRPISAPEEQLLADTGSANSYVINPTPPLTSYGSGNRYSFIAANTNTGASVIQVSGLGNIDLVYRDGSPLDAGAIVAGQHIEVVCDGTDMFLLSPVLLDEDALTSNSDSIGATQQSIKAYVDSFGHVPVGATILWDGGATPPTGYLEKDGAAISRTTYAALFAVYGVKYGSGDGSTTFDLPDDRGRFYRAWDHGAGVDPDASSRTDRGDGTTGDNVGTLQDDAFEAHAHPSGSAVNVNVSSATNARLYDSGGNDGGTTGGNETRPKNTYVMACVKY